MVRYSALKAQKINKQRRGSLSKFELRARIGGCKFRKLFSWGGRV